MKKLLLLLGISIIASGFCAHNLNTEESSSTDTYRLVFEGINDGDRSCMRYMYYISDICDSCDKSYYNQYNKIEASGAVNKIVYTYYKKELTYIFPKSTQVSLSVKDMGMVDLTGNFDKNDEFGFKLYKNNSLLFDFKENDSYITINQIIK